MKVFFIGSPRFNWSNQKIIFEVLLEMGYQHTSKFAEEVNPEKFYLADSEEWKDRYVTRLKEMKAADFCVFEASTPSHAIGQLVQEALREDIPVIALHTHEYRPRFMEGSSGCEKRLQVIAYTLDDLHLVLADAIEEVKDLLITRFTMLIPAKMVKFLDSINKTRGISKSEFIRELIGQEMEKA